MKLDAYDVSYTGSGSGLKLRALCPDGEGGKEVLDIPAPFRPYCYINEESLVTSDLKATGTWLGDGAPEGYLKIEGDDPGAIRDFRDRYAFQTYEADVDYATRVCIDEDVRVERPEPREVLYFDIEVDDRGSFTDSSDAGDRIIAIAGVGGDGEEVYFDDPDEEELLTGFIEAADDYAALAGWNSIGYDFEYLDNRLLEHSVNVDWRRWVRLDVMPLYDMLAVPTKTVSTKLDDTGERELGVGKTGVVPGGGELYRLWQEDPEELREYNMRDSELVKRIDEKYGLIELLHTICGICNYPPGHACYKTKHGQVRFAIGQVVDAKLLEVAHRKGIPQPNKGTHDKGDDFPGGYVLKPRPGMYDDVVVPDYSGMYPNIVRAFNFGRETWVPDDMLEQRSDGTWEIMEGQWRGCRAIKGESGGFVHPGDGERSVPAEAADELVGMREGAGEIVDKGVKAVNNTLYGVFAADHQRYFGPHSENITLVGQELTGAVEDIAGSGHPDIKEVVYGDTDSVMINMDDPDDPVEAAGRIASDVEEEMKRRAAETGANPEYLNLDVDDVYDRFYIGDKKKRYFGHRMWKDGDYCDDFKVRGFEVRQGDWPEPVRDFQERLMHARIDDEPTGPIVDEAEDALFNGEYDLDMATSKSLGQPIEEYDPPMPHSRAAQMLVNEFGEGAVEVGDKVDYIKYGPQKTDIVWVRNGEVGRDFRPNEGYCGECSEVARTDQGGHEHGTEEYPMFRPNHYSYLWQKKFETVMDSIGVSDSDQVGLGAFA